MSNRGERRGLVPAKPGFKLSTFVHVTQVRSWLPCSGHNFLNSVQGCLTVGNGIFKYGVLSEHLIDSTVKSAVCDCAPEVSSFTLHHGQQRAQHILLQVKFSRKKTLANISVKFIHVLFNYLGAFNERMNY